MMAALAVVVGVVTVGAPTVAAPDDPPGTTSTTSTEAVGPTPTTPAGPSTTDAPVTTSWSVPATAVDPLTTTAPTSTGATTAPAAPAVIPPTTPTAEPDGGGDLVILAEPGAGTLGLSKTASVVEVSPGESFDYTFVASCSGLERSCINAVLTDTIPAGLVLTAPLESTDQYDVTIVGSEITVAFKIPLQSPNPPGSVGIPDGAALNIVVPVQLPAESQIADGSTLTNTARMTATGSDPVADTASVDVDVPKVVTPVAIKAWADGSAVAGTGEASTMTLGVRNGSSSTAEVTELSLVDATPAVFERFDVSGLGPVTFPAGSDRLVVQACTEPLSACGDDDYVASAPQTGAPLTLPVPAEDITGLRFVFTNAAGTVLPYDPTGGRVEVGLVLRDTIRSTDVPYDPAVNDRVLNCVTPGAVEDELGPSDGTEVCAPYIVYPAQATISVAKQFFSDTNGDFAPDGRAVVGQGSPVTALTTVTNTSPFPLSTLTITEPSATSTSELDKVDVTDVRIVFPTGATTATVVVDCGAGPVVLGPFANPPVTRDLPDVCPTRAESVAITFTGVDAGGVGTIAANATARLGVRGPLNDDADASDVNLGPGASGDGVANCVDAAGTSSIDGVGAAAGSACATLTLEAAYTDVVGIKSAQLPTILPGLPRRFDLSFTNRGTIPAVDVVMADPVEPTATPNPFTSVRLADLIVPASPPGTAEVYDPSVDAYVPYVAGDAALLARVTGFRVRVPTLAPGATYRVTFNVILRDGVDEGSTFSNCAGFTSVGAPGNSFCSQSITVGALTSGASLQKAVTPAESVRPQAGLPGEPVQLKLSVQNTGTLFLRQLVATDTSAAFFDAVDLTGAVNINFPLGADRVRVDACTGACGPGDFTLGTVTGSRTPPLPVPAADVRGVRVVFTAVPVPTPTFPDGDEFRITPGANFPSTGPCTDASVCIGLRPRIDLRSAPGTPVPDQLLNTATGGYESRQQTTGAAPIPATSATHRLTSGTAQLQFSKTPDRTAAPGQSIPFVLRASNTGTGPIPDLTIVEPIPTGLDFNPLDPTVPYDIVSTLPAGAPEPPEPTFTITTDPVTGRATSLRWDFPGWDLVPGAVVRIQVRTTLAPGAVAGQVISNRAGASSARPDATCNLTGIPRPGEAVGDPAFGPGRYCTSAAEVTAGEGNAFNTQKWVAGDASLGFLDTRDASIVGVTDPSCPVLELGGQRFTRFPCVARVLPGNGFDYYLQLINAGTNPATEVRLVDVFPHPGDTGVLLTGSARGTEWAVAPSLLTPVALAGRGTLDVDYTTAPAPVCTGDLALPAVPCDAGSFPTGFSTSATAFRAVVSFPPDDRLLPGETTGLRFRMVSAPDVGGATDDVAWNSFAHTEYFATGAATAQLPPTEPIKVGVAIVYGGLTIAKTLVDPAGTAAGLTFEIVYECSVSPEGGGSAVVVAEGSVSVPGGGSADVAGVPAGATCLVWEPDPQGLATNAPTRDDAISVAIPIDGTVANATATVVNEVSPPPTDSTTTTTVDPASTTTGPAVTTTTTTAPAAVTTTTVTGAGGSGGAGGTSGRPGGRLPATGSDLARGLAVAALLVGAGLVVLGGTRQRRRADD